jgi:hypothetical protein
MRKLWLTDTQYVEVFLVSGSAEERKLYVGDIIGDLKPRIVLCSMQYIEEVTDTIQYFETNGYAFYTHWLNPGYSDLRAYTDHLGLVQSILDLGGTVEQRDGKVDVAPRVEEMRQHILQWAAAQSLVRTESPVHASS